MAIVERIEKRQLVIDLGANETPTAWRWRVMHFLTYEDGSDVAPPRQTEIPASAEEVSAHIGATVVQQSQAITADRANYDSNLASLTAQRDAWKAKFDKAELALRAVVSADQSWDDAVRAKVVEALS